MQNASHSRVFLAPDQLTADEIRENTRLMTVNEITRDYVLSEAENLAELRPPPPTEVVTR